MIVRAITMGLFRVNSYVVWDEDSKEALLIDPGAEFEHIMHVVEIEKILPRFLLLTHAHFDHVEGVNALKKHYSLPLVAHPEGQRMLDGLPEQAALFDLTWEQPIPRIDRFLSDGETITIGGEAFRVMYTPGHSICGVSYAGDGIAFVGDLIFRDAVGRTDFKGGSSEALLNSIHSRIFTLPPHTRLLSGHGPETTVEREMAENPFV